MNRRTSIALCVAALAFVLFECVRSLTRLDGVIFTGYTQVGEVLLSGGDPYSLAINTWPPFFLFIAGALALAARVSLPGVVLLWQVGSVLALWGAIRLLARFFVAGGDRLTFWPREGNPAFTTAAVLVPVVMTARLVQEHLQHTQINLFVFYLCLLAFHLFRTRRAAWGGAALAVAASTKAIPILLCGYLAYRRRWRELAWTGAFLVALNAVLPVAVFGPARTAEHWRSWRAVSAAEIADPAPRSSNQSLLAAMKRLLTAEGSAGDAVTTGLVALSPQAVRWVFAGIAGLAALALAWAFGITPPPLDGRRAAVEWAIGIAAMTIVSPLAWKAHYVTLIALYFIAWQALVARPARWAWGVWWGSFACLTLSAPAVVGGRARDVLESLDVITVGAVLVVLLALRGLRDAGEPVPRDARHS